MSRIRPRSQKLGICTLGSSVISDYNLNAMGSGIYSTIELGTYRPIASESSFLHGVPLKSLNSTRYKLGGLKLGSRVANSRNQKLTARTNSVLSVNKVVDKEGGGRENYYDAVVIGSGIGGLVAATQLAVKGAKVLTLEKYVIPGGSSGYYQRDGYTFDVGSSVMFGFSDKVRSFSVTK